jgi:hypothetical protein
MFSKEESRQLNYSFGNGFNEYMSKVRSSNGRKTNWSSYPSDVKSIFIRLEVDSKGARLCFDIQHKDDELRAIIWEQMTELKMVLEDITDSSPIWTEEFHYLNKYYISRIVWEDKTLNFYKSEQRDQIYSYLKEKLVKFDIFYQEYKEILIALAN